MRRRGEAFYDTTDPIAVAHRGGNAANTDIEDYQNTIRACIASRQRGVTVVEIDLRRRSDGQAGVAHDAENVDRAETLVEFLTNPELQDVRFMLDLKESEVMGPTAQAVREAEAHDRVSLGTRNYGPETAALLTGDGKEICVGVGVAGALALKFSNLLTRDFIERTGVTSFHIPHYLIPFLVNNRALRRADNRGVKLIGWPKNPQKNDHRRYIETALDRGIHGVKSDHTGMLVEVFESRGHHGSLGKSLGEAALNGLTTSDIRANI